ncbi:MAG: hypothetical protein ACLQO7_02225 [Candidatus Bathyarchaeia archaeon]
MVEIEVHASEPKAKKEPTTSIDVTKIIEKVRDLVGNVREMAGEPMDVNVDSFNLTFGKAADGEYSLSVATKIVIKPK